MMLVGLHYSDVCFRVVMLQWDCILIVHTFTKEFFDGLLGALSTSVHKVLYYPHGNVKACICNTTVN